MSTKFSKDTEEKLLPTENSVKFYAEIMSAKFSKDFCGNNVDEIQKGFTRE